MSYRWGCAVLAALCLAAPLRAQEEAPEEESSLKPKLEFGFEAKAHYRDSDLNRFRVPFDFPPGFLPVGQTSGFEETVNAGSHLEISVVTLLIDATWGDGLAAHGKIDFIDLYDRNPTSSDKKTDVDEAWVRFGIEPAPATLAPRWGAYLKIGKMPKFERQDDRHLESYGLVSTSFNRFEDTGVEAGVSLGRHVYVKATATQGNPLFIRDPNALAGDRGTPELAALKNPDPALKSGIVLMYDAEVEDLDVDGDLELGGGVGVRCADEAGVNGVDVLAWTYQRTLAQTVELEGTVYGGDLEFLRGPFNDFPYPIKGDEKKETGGNVWAYWGGLSFFGQYVDQEVAGLARTGLEGELAWRFDLPLWASIGDHQLFTFVAPAVRYSALDNDFLAPEKTPAPSLAWDWTKLDYGVRVGIIAGSDLTIEYADNEFTLRNGAKRDNNEFLTTFRWRL
jgi:hypothetical protein